MGETVSCCMPSFSPPANRIEFSKEDACRVAKTGDIILFSGTSFNSKIIEWVCPSVWSHIGIIFEDPERENDPSVFESVESSDNMREAMAPCAVRPGVRVVRLKEYLEGYKGNAIAIRTLQCEKQYIKSLRKYMTNVLTKQIIEHNGKPYEKRLFEFVNARYRFFSNPKKTLDSFFCSELVAEVFMRAGLLESDIKSCPSVFLPDDFGDTGDLKLCTPKCLSGAHIKLGPERFIETKKISNSSSTSNQLYYKSEIQENMYYSQSTNQNIFNTHNEY
jgi:hypothetical protein